MKLSECILNIIKLRGNLTTLGEGLEHVRGKRMSDKPTFQFCLMYKNVELELN